MIRTASFVPMLAILAIFSSAALARIRISGACHDSCTVTVLAPGTSSVIAVYSQENGTAHPNPFTGSARSQWSVYSDTDEVDVKVAGPGYSEGVTIHNYVASPSVFLGGAGAKCDGLTDDSQAFAKATAVLSTTGGAIAIPANHTCAIGTGFSTPENVSLSFGAGASLSLASGADVKLSGPILATAHPIFRGAGMVRLGPGASGSGALGGVPIEWFGAVGDWNGSMGTDNTAAIQQAANAVKGSYTPGEVRNVNSAIPNLLVGARSYMWSGTLTFPDFQYLQFVGAGANVSFLVHKALNAATDGIVFSSGDGNYRYANGLRNLTVFSASSKTRRLISLSGQAEFNGDDLIAEGSQTSGAGLPQIVLYLEGMIASHFYRSRFYNAKGDNIFFGAANSSTSTSFKDCWTEAAGGAGVNLEGSSTTISFDSCVFEGNKYGVRLAHDSLIMLSNNHFEHNNTNSIFNDGGGRLSYIQSINNHYIGADSPGYVMFDIDSVHMWSVGDSLVTYKTAYRTTANSVVEQFGDALNKSYGYVFNTGAGQFSGANTPMPILQWYDGYGNVAGDFGIVLHRGGFQRVLLTGDTVLHLQSRSQNYPPGTQITLYFVQDGAGGNSIRFGSGSEDYPVRAALSASGNSGGKVSVLTLTWDGSQFVQTSYTPWF